MARTLLRPTARNIPTIGVRLGGVRTAGSTAHLVTDSDVRKFFKLAGESRYDLAAVGDPIEGTLFGLETSTHEGYSFGSIAQFVQGDLLDVTFDGIQATPGTGTLVIGDFVRVGTPKAKGTPLGIIEPPRVVKATDAGNLQAFKWRVVSLGLVGTGAVGTTGVIQFIG
jgi:hypothetical protein